MGLSIIVAMTRQGVIGQGGTLPWRLSADLKRFKSLTMGHHLIMGRKTFESLGQPLPGRISIVISRSDRLSQAHSPREGEAPAEPIRLASSLDAALALAAGDGEPFVIGGGEVFALALPRADRLYVTWVEAEMPGDTWFPPWNPAPWRLVRSEPHAADAKNEYDTLFCIYDRT